MEHRSPNEELIRKRVETWSYSHQLVRLKIPLGIADDSDVRKALQIAEGASVLADRVLTDPPPVGRMMGFGDSAIELELRVWINDPKNGVTNVKSDVLLHILDAFRENGVEIPFPRREVYLNAKSPVPVTMVEDPSSAGS